MVGIVLVSHGKMCKGMIDSASMFFGNLENVESVCFEMDENMETLLEKVKKAIKSVDKGKGVYVLTDLYGGTPTNCILSLANENVRVITGMNLPMFVELLGARLCSSDIDIDKIIKIGRDGIIDVNEILCQENSDDDCEIL